MYDNFFTFGGVNALRRFVAFILSFHLHYFTNGKVLAYIGKEKSHKDEIREEKHEKQKI